MSMKGNLSGERVEAGSTDIPESGQGAVRITKQRALQVNLRDNEGAEIGVAGNPIPVDASGAAISGTVEIDQTTPGTTNGVVVNGSALPSGAATAANQATAIGHIDGIESLLGTIDADTSALSSCVSGTEMQTDVVSAPAITHGKTIKSKSGTVGSSGNNTIVAAVADKKITVFAIKLIAVTETALTAAWQDGASGTEVWRDYIQTPADVAAGANLAVTPPGYLFQLSTNTLLNLNLSSAVNVHYAVSYWEE